jgi:diguanylate cyclase (GGDEF)-like protein/putative nucleotidyltransferase with HDIG domain
VISAWQIGVAANLIVSVAYIAISWSVLGPLLRERARGLNLLGLTTAGIFLSCAVHHSGHALAVVASGHQHPAAFTLPLVVWDVATMGVGVLYWAVRRGDGPTMQGGQLFADLEAQRRATAEQATLRSVATAVAEERPPEELFALVAREMAALLDAECALIARFDWSEARVVGSSGGPAAPLGWRSVLPSAAALGAVHRTGEAVRVCYDALRDDPVGQIARAAGFRRGVAAPVMVGANVWGAVLVASTRRDGLAGPDIEDRVTRFGELVGLGVANAAARARMAEAAAHDALTGLANERVFNERLIAESSRAERHGRPLSLVLLDLDHFKAVNDDHGQQVGDRVLAEVARRLLSMSREEDLVARIGGEQFALLLPDPRELGGYQVAERARKAVAGTPFAGAGMLTVSGGICSLERAGRPHNLVRLAKGALYWAKANGRDACFIYTPEVVEALTAEERAETLARSRTIAGLRALAQAVDARDPTTLAHSERVARLAARIAAELGWTAGDAGRLREAALLHDVGKIGVPDAVLFKPGRLDGDEYAAIVRHVELGAQIVAEVLDEEQVTWVRQHHERVDGHGYPHAVPAPGLAEGSMILAASDAWDAMTAPRVYRDPLTLAQALAEVRAQAGAQFAPHVVAVMERLHAEGAPEMRAATLDAPLLLPPLADDAAEAGVTLR